MDDSDLDGIVRRLAARPTSRREVLRGLAGAGAATIIGGGVMAADGSHGHTAQAGPSASATPPSPAPSPSPLPIPPQGPDLVEPEVIQSVDRVLATTLTPKLTTVEVGGREVMTTVYNESFPGPTLRMNPGETLRIKLVNELSDMTNLHTHGFHTTPEGFGDNVLHHMAAGETWDLEMPTLPDHPSGLYWYHPHAHGDSDGQVNGGMAGAIINSGPIDELPGIKGLTERLLLIQATQFGEDGTLVTPAFAQTTDGKVRYVNGQINPVIRIAPGETQRWRIGNLSSDTFVDLVLDGHVLNQIADDANPMDEVQPMDHILLGPAERAEVLVQPAEAGTYYLRTLPANFDLEVVIATLIVEGDPVEPQPLPTTLIPFEDLRTATVDAYQDITFEILDGPKFTINGKEFDENRIDITAKLGTVEEWTIRNGTTSWHPFHIHINDFQVVGIDGEPHDAHGYQDTMPIAPGGYVTMRTRYADFPGKWVYHCHILGHEDAGMMGIIEVVE